MKYLTLAALAAATLLMTAVACTDEPAPTSTDVSRSTSQGLDLVTPTPGGTDGSGATGASGSTSSPVVTSTPAPNGTPPPTVTQPPRPLPTPGSDRRIVEAPIDHMAIRVAESAPPQYFLEVTSGLPSGCAQFYRVDIARSGAVITVKVLNTMPANDRQACTMIYGMKQHNLALGSDFQSGVTYMVHLNDEKTTFTAQ